MLVFLLALGLVFVSCDNGTSPGGDTPNNETEILVGTWQGSAAGFPATLVFTADKKWTWDLSHPGGGEHQGGDYTYNSSTGDLVLTGIDSETKETISLNGKAVVSNGVLSISGIDADGPDLGPKLLNGNYTSGDNKTPGDDDDGKTPADNGNLVGEWERPYSYMGMMHFQLYLTFTANTWKWEIIGDSPEPPKEGQYTYNPSTKALVLTGEDEGEALELRGKATVSNDGHTLIISGLTEDGKLAEDPGPGMLNGTWSSR
jgi:hypothetical protein